MQAFHASRAVEILTMEYKIKRLKRAYAMRFWKKQDHLFAGSSPPPPVSLGQIVLGCLSSVWAFSSFFFSIGLANLVASHASSIGLGIVGMLWELVVHKRLLCKIYLRRRCTRDRNLSSLVRVLVHALMA